MAQGQGRDVSDWLQRWHKPRTWSIAYAHFAVLHHLYGVVGGDAEALI